MENGSVSFSLLELFRMGGIFMWPLLFFSIAVIAIALERAIYLGYHNLRLDDLAAKVEEGLKTDSLAGTREYLSTQTKRRMGARVLLTLVDRSGLTGKDVSFSEHRVEKAAETEALSCINSLESGFNFLTALGSLSPLTGFLGTVSGMIGAFKSIAEATEVNAQIVANGIYEALITTVFGLIIAIIAMIAHSVFSHIVDKFSADAEQTCSYLITEIAVRSEAAADSNTAQAENSEA
jgi:biopolymer transport protein ExbB